MNAWIIYLSLVLGITYLVTEAGVFFWLRAIFRNRGMLKYLVYCATCVGFWVGVAAHVAFPAISLTPQTPLPARIGLAALSGLAALLLNHAFTIWKGGNRAYGIENPDHDHTESEEAGPHDDD